MLQFPKKNGISSNSASIQQWQLRKISRVQKIQTWQMTRIGSQDLCVSAWLWSAGLICVLFGLKRVIRNQVSLRFHYYSWFILLASLLISLLPSIVWKDLPSLMPESQQTMATYNIASNADANLVLQTICGTGIRVSELQYFTVEDVRRGEITVSCKSKTRNILVPGKLKKMLLNHAKRRGIVSGSIFVGRNGKTLDRSSIWRQMKQLCTEGWSDKRKGWQIVDLYRPSIAIGVRSCQPDTVDPRNSQAWIDKKRSINTQGNGV